MFEIFRPLNQVKIDGFVEEKLMHVEFPILQTRQNGPYIATPFEQVRIVFRKMSNFMMMLWLAAQSFQILPEDCFKSKKRNGPSLNSQDGDHHFFTLVFFESGKQKMSFFGEEK